MAIETVDFPIKNGGSFHSYVAVDQRVWYKSQQPLCASESRKHPRSEPTWCRSSPHGWQFWGKPNGRDICI